MRRVILAVVLAVATMVGVVGGAFAANGADYDIANGHFYTQTGNGNGAGFAVVDGGQDGNGQSIRFWTEFRRLGGVPTLGYPVSQRYAGDGAFVYQAFQRGVLQWRPDRNGALLANTFEWLQNGGKDAWLKDARGIPEPIADDGSNGDYAKAVQTRLGWLTNAQIKSKFLANPGSVSGWNQDKAIELYGLPMSQPEKNGPFITQRFQRIAFQLWVEDVSGMPAKGTVVGVLGGDLLKESGLLTGNPVAPLAAGQAGELNPSTVVQATPTPTPPPSPTYAWRSEMVGWSSNCGTTYVFGNVYDRGGNLRNGVSIKSWNDWGNEVISGSGSDSNRGTGGWVRLVNSAQNPQTWYVAIVDGSGNLASAPFTVRFDGDCNSGAQVVQVNFHEN